MGLASPIKRKRRTRSEIDTIREAIYSILLDYHPMTVRQVFYQLVSMGVIAKKEQEYKSTTCRLLVKMRRAGEIPFDWIADNTRWMRKPRTFSSLGEALRDTARTYRRAVWDEQPAYVELWLEKDALAGVLMEETEPWDVPLMVARGFSSVTYLYEAAQYIAAQEKPAYLYHFGDHDPSGVDIPRKIESELRNFAPHAEIHFERVAVTPEQVASMQLPTRPTKKTDSRSRSFVGDSVDVDAIPPRQLRELARNCITRHVDRRIYDQLMIAEKAERAALQGWIREAA